MKSPTQARVSRLPQGIIAEAVAARRSGQLAGERNPKAGPPEGYPPREGEPGRFHSAVGVGPCIAMLCQSACALIQEDSLY